MEHWDGENWTAEVNQVGFNSLSPVIYFSYAHHTVGLTRCNYSQEIVDDSRRLTLAQIVLAQTNTLDKVKNTVARLAEKINVDK